MWLKKGDFGRPCHGGVFLLSTGLVIQMAQSNYEALEGSGGGEEKAALQVCSFGLKPRPPNR